MSDDYRDREEEGGTKRVNDITNLDIHRHTYIHTHTHTNTHSQVFVLMVVFFSPVASQ